MTLIKLISEKEAQGRTKEIYEDVKAHYRLKFVPAVFKAWANQPNKLNARWEMTKKAEQKLGKRQFHIIGLSTSVVMGCSYCVNFHSRVLQDEGFSDHELEFLMETITGMAASGLYASGLQLKPDAVPTQARLAA